VHDGLKCAIQLFDFVMTGLKIVVWTALLIVTIPLMHRRAAARLVRFVVPSGSGIPAR